MRLLKAPLLSSQPLLPRTSLLWVEAPPVAAEAQPGQMVMVRCGQDPFSLRRPLAVHRVQGERVALLVKEVGWGTCWLCGCPAGQALDLLGPLGKGFTVPSEARRLLLIAGGMGIAPLFFLAERELAAGKSVTLLLGARSSQTLYPRHLIPRGVELHLATEDGSIGKKGLATDLLKGIPDHYDAVFACGPLPMYRALKQGRHPVLAGKTIEVSVEVRMGCGFGVCMGCALPTRSGMKLACREGPVFPLEELSLEGIRL